MPGSGCGRGVLGMVATAPIRRAIARLPAPAAGAAANHAAAHKRSMTFACHAPTLHRATGLLAMRVAQVAPVVSAVTAAGNLVHRRGGPGERAICDASRRIAFLATGRVHLFGNPDDLPQRFAEVGLLGGGEAAQLLHRREAERPEDAIVVFVVFCAAFLPAPLNERPVLVVLDLLRRLPGVPLHGRGPIHRANARSLGI